MKVKSERLITRIWSEIRSITAWKLFSFIGLLMIIFLALRFLLLKILGLFYAGWGTKYTFKSLSSCEPYYVNRLKFYDLNYISAYIKHGTWVAKAFYFLLVPLGIYLLLTRFFLKEKTIAIKIISIIIGIEVAVIIYLLLPSFFFCLYTAPVTSPQPSF